MVEYSAQEPRTRTRTGARRIPDVGGAMIPGGFDGYIRHEVRHALIRAILVGLIWAAALAWGISGR